MIHRKEKAITEVRKIYDCKSTKVDKINTEATTKTREKATVS